MNASQNGCAEVGRLLIVLAGLLIMACEGPSQPPVREGAARRLGTVDVKGLNEISGLAASRRNAGVLWVHDDGDIEEVYAVDTSGAVVARISLDQDVEDCEDMALGAGPGGSGDYLYLGDIGDNDEERDSIQVLRFAESELTPGERIETSAQNFQRLRLTYPDAKHDAEALLVDPASGDLLIVTKENGRAGVYRVPTASWQSDKVVRLEHILTLGIEKISAGDISHDGQWIALRREEVGWLWRRQEGQDIVEALRGPAITIAVRGSQQDDNGEAIAFHPDGRGFYTISEGKRQPLYFFRLP